MTNNVISLLRVSTDAQDVARQTADLERMKTKFGLTVARVLELVGVSGTATLEDSQVQQILKDLELPAIDGIAVSALDRLFRPGKRYGQFAILDRFVDEHKKIWSIREGLIDPSTDEGYDKCISAGGRAGAEWRELIRRTHDGRIEHLRAGKLDHGNAPDGFVYIPKWQTNGNRFAIDPERASIIRLIFDWCRQGIPLYRIARDLNNRGIRSARGGRWSRQVVLQTLHKPAYKGEHRRYGIIVPCPVIIEPELWDECQQIIAKNLTKHTGRPALQPILLRGLLWCGRCGRRCLAKGRAGKNCQYRCGNYELKPPYVRHCHAPGIAQQAIETAAWSEIWGMLRNPELLLALARAYFESQQQQNCSDSLQNELTHLKAKLQTTQAMVKDGLLDYSQGRAEIRSLQTQIKEHETEIRAAGKVVSMPAVTAIEAAVEDVQHVLAGPEPTTYEGRRSILEGILDLRMVYDSGDLIIEGNIPMPAESTISDGKKRKRYVDAACTSFASIPFILKKRVA